MGISEMRALAALPILLAACATAAPRPAMTEAEFSNVQQIMRESPTMRARLVSECRDRPSSRPAAAASERLAALMQVSEPELPVIFCERLIAGMAEGRLGYPEYLATRSGEMDTATFSRLVDVLRDPGLGQSL